MARLRIPPLLLLATAFALSPGLAQPSATAQPAPQDLNTPRDFPPIASRQEWLARAKDIHDQVLVSCGLWPLPEKSTLDAHVFGKIIREGYSVEKVYFRTFPGFYLAGNLYRPVGHGKGPFPAILNPHGHWDQGRLADTKDGSTAARCISFARQGMIAFSYDMVGFNDTHFADTSARRPFYELHREFATNRADLLWNVSLMGLQTWNSIRALDFLESLPDADRERLACTGESGGGTQTFMLGALDNRLAVQAPVVMVSHIMQGGCLCENAPGLRVEYSNMEIDAAAAPRPQILVAATGDWTKDTPRVEGPAIANIYQMLGARNKFDFEQFDFGHNYNRTSREAVYAFFGKWLLKGRGGVQEAPYQKEPDAALRVFPEGQLPADALTQAEFINALKALHRAEWLGLLPRTLASLRHFKETMLPAWRHTLLVDWPRSRVQIDAYTLPENQEYTTALVKLHHGNNRTVVARYWAPPEISSNASPKLVVLSSAIHGSDSDAGAQRPRGLLLKLLESGAAVLAIQEFSTGEASDQFANFYTTYNRTVVQERVRDLLAVCSAAGSVAPGKSLAFRVILCGQGRAGIWSILAAPAADAVIADAVALDADGGEAWLAPDLFCPGILNLGGYQTAAMLAAPHPLLLHNAGAHFHGDGLRAAYAAAGTNSRLSIEPELVSDAQLLAWLAHL